MEKLSELKLQNEDQELTNDQLKVLNKYFEQQKDVVLKACGDSKIKQAMFFTIIFILLNNPITDGLLELVASPNLRYLLKIFVFFILSYVVILITSK
mgnify:CR=1 FL=1